MTIGTGVERLADIVDCPGRSSRGGAARGGADPLIALGAEYWRLIARVNAPDQTDDSTQAENDQLDNIDDQIAALVPVSAAGAAVLVRYLKFRMQGFQWCERDDQVASNLIAGLDGLCGDSNAIAEARDTVEGPAAGANQPKSGPPGAARRPRTMAPRLPAAGDDAEILDLFHRWIEGQRAAARLPTSTPSDDAVYNAALVAIFELERGIANIAAAGAAGMAVKTYLVAFYEGGGTSEEAASLAGLDEEASSPERGGEMYISAHFALSLIHDAARFVPEIGPLAVRMIGPTPRDGGSVP